MSATRHVVAHHGGQELLEFRNFFDPQQGSAAESARILDWDREKFSVLTLDVLRLFRRVWNSALTFFLFFLCGSLWFFNWNRRGFVSGPSH